METALSHAGTYTGLPAPRSPISVDTMRRGAGTGPVDESKVDPAMRQTLRKKAGEFEEMFVGQMLTPLFEGVEVDDTFGGGHGEEMFRSMLTQEYAKQVNRRGGFGIADSVYRELLRAQEMSHGQG
ncbi:MAG TPA: rod-binding protein [Azospirillum sp.]